MDLLIILIAISFLAVIITKPLFNKLHIPLSFSAMFIGMFLGLFPLWQEVILDSSFVWLANLGMLFLIFSIIFQVSDAPEKKSVGFKKYLLKSGIIIISLELLVLFPLAYFFLERNFLSALLISLIFTTVAEAMVIPFLRKFGILDTLLGKSAVGIGILDNIFELLVLVIASLVSIGGGIAFNNFLTALIFAIIAFIFIKYLSKIRFVENLLDTLDLSGLFILVMGTLFLFAGILSFVNLEFFGAVIAALMMKNLMKTVPKEHVLSLTNMVNMVADGLFGPIFFLWVGVSISLSQLVQRPVLTVVFVLVGLFAKIIPTIIATRKKLNLHSSIILGIALKFGAGIIFIKLLFEKGMLTELTYTLTIAAIFMYRIIIPFLLGFFINKWKKDIV